jgi:hypothetical protein
MIYRVESRYGNEAWPTQEFEPPDARGRQRRRWSDYATLPEAEEHVRKVDYVQNGLREIGLLTNRKKLEQRIVLLED